MVAKEGRTCWRGGGAGHARTAHERCEGAQRDTTYLEAAAPEQFLRPLQRERERALCKSSLLVLGAKAKDVEEEVFDFFRAALLLRPLLPEPAAQLGQTHLLIDELLLLCSHLLRQLERFTLLFDGAVERRRARFLRLALQRELV